MSKIKHIQTGSHEKDVMKDSLFGIVGSFSTEEGNWSEGDDWRD